MTQPKISDFVTYKEGTHSNTAVAKKLDNTPTPEILLKMQIAAKAVFDPTRKALGPMRVNCFYRAPEVNKAVGGSRTSQHTKGEAIDISGLGELKNSQIFNFIRANLQFTQLIAEFPVKGEPAWIHVGYDPKNLKNEILIATKGKMGTVYVPYAGNASLINKD